MGFRFLVGVFVGLFLISPLISGDMDISQLSTTTQSILEKAVWIVQLIASDGTPGVSGV